MIAHVKYVSISIVGDLIENKSSNNLQFCFVLFFSICFLRGSGGWCRWRGALLRQRWNVSGELRSSVVDVRSDDWLEFRPCNLVQSTNDDRWRSEECQPSLINWESDNGNTRKKGFKKTEFTQQKQKQQNAHQESQRETREER